MAIYYAIPVVDGELDIDWNNDSFRVIRYNESCTIAFCEYNYGNIRDSWIEISEKDFLSNVPEENKVFETYNDSQKTNNSVDYEFACAKILSLLFDVLVNQNDMNKKILKLQENILIKGD